jgi:uncharacterized protein involved in exopolysaccharide biosynthesis
VVELQKSVVGLRRPMTEPTEKENELRQLEADADISRTLPEPLANRIGVAESAIVEEPDARILNLAKAPVALESTRKKLLLLGAFAFSSLAALGLELLNGGRRSEEELRRSLG